MQVVEIFHSRQGEGLWTGADSAFIRTSGCNLRCRFCDTPYASWNPENGENLSPEEIRDRIVPFNAPHAVITGGEPMLVPELEKLTAILADSGKTITIETAGTVFQPVCCDLLSISPKMRKSTPVAAPDEVIRRHETARCQPDIVRRLIETYPYQIKFVLDTPDDLPEIEDYLETIGPVDPARVCLMPMAVDVPAMESRAVWMRPYCEKNGFFYSPRMQIVWYGNRRGT